ncbi:hypothetical protein Ae201684_012497 [Aphanomyces euteiches]|uniref:Methyltransferase type 12 domain-containing protein n=1 Tax=Aphanomyces euteiches TaxID=100861 RepID=A0A6G0WRC8_9STRA|nr:hypothetical protein Ae201684_012497 [Aphanomyces euteiches]KAH9134338.1 hypothetical protein AeRB84_019791 [Aphanomyces euteiches]
MASKARNDLILGVISSLSSAMVAPDIGNVEGNRRVWDAYAKDWSPTADFVQSMSPQFSHPLAVLGDEWSTPEDLHAVLDAYVYPYLAAGESLHVGEIGSGGGRVSRIVARQPTVSKYVCMDISAEMLAHAKKTLEDVPHVEFKHLPRAWPAATSLDFVIVFDVMVHMDLHTIHQTLQQIHRLLKPGGHCFLSTANLLAPKGWERFEKQSKFSIGGFYFLCPQMVDFLVVQNGFTIALRSQPRGDNMYENRDYLVVIQKPV